MVPAVTLNVVPLVITLSALAGDCPATNKQRVAKIADALRIVFVFMISGLNDCICFYLNEFLKYVIYIPNGTYRMIIVQLSRMQRMEKPKDLVMLYTSLILLLSR